MTQIPLRKALKELALEMDKLGAKLIIGDGYGLYEKQEKLFQSEEVTVMPRHSWPQPRSTTDLDIFLEAELVADLVQMRKLRLAVDALGYEVVDAAKFMHFKRPAASGADVEINFLTGPIESEELRKK
jgi:hypothetical protein